jgi:hypothetical protein
LLVVLRSALRRRRAGQVVVMGRRVHVHVNMIPPWGIPARAWVS